MPYTLPSSVCLLRARLYYKNDFMYLFILLKKYAHKAIPVQQYFEVKAGERRFAIGVLSTARREENRVG
jgi:hypothetical protein